jgi:pyruvate,orthophosphate dikinase
MQRSELEVSDMARKRVYLFGGGHAEGTREMKDLLGGKGANLAEMTNIGIPVPAGFTITTEVCTEYYANGGTFPEGLREEVAEALAKVESIMGKKFGSTENPLLLSGRSGARVSMPGMMDTVLNIGLNDDTVQALARASGDERFAFDSYRRFVQMFSNVVLGVDSSVLEEILEQTKERLGVRVDSELPVEALKEMVSRFKATIEERTGRRFPEDPQEQLWEAIAAVFRSWNTPRAISYRRINKIPDEWGTAVNVQSMVFGNMGDDCATGVAFTRDPATGENRFYGEFLPNAQGEDVVAGIRTPQPINEESKKEGSDLPSLEALMPDVYRYLVEIRRILERHYRDMQDIEFTIERGKLWMLQTRTGKRTGFAAIRIAVDMVEEGLITREEALLRVEPDHLSHLLAPMFDPQAKEQAVAAGRFLATGLAAGPGAATGKVVFDAEDVVARKARDPKEPLILVRIETSPEDIEGMHQAEGILTARGGMTSHAAVVARGMGKSCVAGCGALEIDYDKKLMRVGDHVIREGEFISIDGSTGEVIEGQIPTLPSEVIQVLIEKTLSAEESPIYRRYSLLLSWADEVRRLRVRTNADTPRDSANAVAFGAEGIGLCRTEHMFFDDDFRRTAIREMIMAETREERERALAKLLPIQREDFCGIFRAMAGRPVTIRTLDPPLHEFLPKTDEDVAQFAEATGVSAEHVRQVSAQLHEANPMLGHRGCRLGITYPEITAMQARAIFEAAVQVQDEGVEVHPEVMVPLVADARELELQREVIDRVAAEVMKETGREVRYLVGTMIELPRAALTADRIAGTAEFFSFGTNDLTQTTYGLSRDDAQKFLKFYLANKVLEDDPFVTIDQEGVGQLMRLAVEKGRAARPEIKIGICGEHGGEPRSVEFCHGLGLEYVSCSPYRVPVARLAAAQAVLKERARAEEAAAKQRE